MAGVRRFTYRGNRLRTISFPLGGIGTGCVGLSGNGHLIDWEIFNRPNKNSLNGFTHIAVRAQRDDKLLDARILQGPQPPPFIGGADGAKFGLGVPRITMAGAPTFGDVRFTGEFPLARVDLRDPRFPGKASLHAFNPFIPLNDKDSSIPAAFFVVELVNDTPDALDYTVCFTLSNPHAGERTSRVFMEEGATGIVLGSDGPDRRSVACGELCIATDAGDRSYQRAWYHGHWFDDVIAFWNDFTASGKLRDRAFPSPDREGSRIGDGAACSLAVHLKADPGKSVSARFVLSWHYPNCRNYWKACCGAGCCGDSPERGQWVNHYATVFNGAQESAVYSLCHFTRLYGQTRDFHDVLFSSTLPREAIDAVSANLSTLKSPTCLRLEGGEFYGWEGCDPHTGCCEGSCTHVWNYAYALPFLFPALERSMRELDYAYNFQPSGAMPFRLQLPLGSKASDFRPCADGQMGGVVKVYREWKICGSSEWLRKLWPKVKASIAYAWSELNPDGWDADKDGVMEGRQHHTLDMELFGPNSWLQGFYLAALKAGAEMAAAMGDEPFRDTLTELFGKGKAWADRHLFNGEYYCQLVDINDKRALERFAGEQKSTDMLGAGVMGAYWNDESGEMKYQIGEGCMIDQVIAQWHANNTGLGGIFDRGQTRLALGAIYRHNFKPRIGDMFNPCAVYALEDESGTIICSYPEGRRKPLMSLPYAEQTMCGFEYQAGIHMIQEGMAEEGMRLVKAVRDRHDGSKRNPWNEFECGSNYARSMSSYALMTAFMGFTYDMTRNQLGFAPVIFPGGRFKGLWSVDAAWGGVTVAKERLELTVHGGELPLAKLYLPGFGRIASVRLGRRAIEFTWEGGLLDFRPPLRIPAGSTLRIR